MKRLRSPPKNPAGVTEKFLRDEYPKSRPLKIHLSALRASQAKILTRNLRAAGAEVIAKDVDTVTPAVIVTDHVPIKEVDGVTYVPPRWAEEVLRRRCAVSPERFSLSTARAKSAVHAKKRKRLNEYLPPERGRVLFPAVWQIDTGRRATPADRKKWLRTMPEYAVERVALTANIHRSPNAALSAMLRDLARVRELVGDGVDGGAMQANAFRNAAAALAALPFSVTVDETGLIRDVGSSAADAIKEFVNTGACVEAKLLKTDERVKALHSLTAVYGVGFKTARKLFEAGVKNEAELVLFSKKMEARALVSSISIFEQPYDALTLDEARAFQAKVIEILAGNGMSLRVVLCGGYRRGKFKGHDVDLVYCRTDTPSTESQAHLESSKEQDTSPLHSRVTSSLFKNDVLAHRLHEEHGGPGGRRARKYGFTAPSHARPIKDLSHEVLHGVCRFQGKFFRADFIGVRDASEMPYATLAWSGTVAFQRSLRRWTVARRGLIFSPHGLFDANTGERATAGAHAVTEHDVFAAMGLTYKPPFERAA